MPTYDLSWVADGADRGVYVAAVSDSGRGAGECELTATGLDFCDCHVSERRGAHRCSRFWDATVSPVTFPRPARILFSPLFSRLPVA